MKHIIRAALAASLAVQPFADGKAAADATAVVAVRTSKLEFVVFETANCIYCSLFRRDVVPAYEASQRSDKPPMRFVDALGSEADKLRLAGPVTQVPTLVLVRDGVEIDRLSGYTAPETFFQAIAYMLGRAD
jgi:thioredoxin-related protein